MKKSLTFLLTIIFCSSLILAQSIDIDLPLGEKFSAGENMTIIVSLTDSNNKPLQDTISLTVEDADKKTKLEQTIQSNKATSIKLSEEMMAGQGTIVASYSELETIKIFEIEEFEKARFEIVGTELVITNIGNTIYDRKIEISIGQTTSIKTPTLEAGKKISYRLVAPDGTYTIEVSDGTSNSLILNNVKLRGTGNVIGAIDESATARTGITGGISPDENSEGEFIEYIKRNKFVYVFIIVIVGATILLTVEKHIKRKVMNQ